MTLASSASKYPEYVAQMLVHKPLILTSTRPSPSARLTKRTGVSTEIAKMMMLMMMVAVVVKTS
jgi:hypothetical protein